LQEHRLKSEELGQLMTNCHHIHPIYRWLLMPPLPPRPLNAAAHSLLIFPMGETWLPSILRTISSPLLLSIYPPPHTPPVPTSMDSSALCVHDIRRLTGQDL